MASYTISIKRSARKAIDRIPQRKLRERVEDVIEALGEDPRPDGAKKLGGTDAGTALRRVKAGAFRVVYEVREEELVLVVLVAQREGVYELLKRLR